MLRKLFLSAAILGFASSALAAHPDPAPETAKTAPQLPSEADIEEMMAQMPDLNALMGDMMKIMSDPKLQKNMERIGGKLEHKLENSGAMKMQDNGMPDFNAAMGAMMSVMGDEDIMGPMLGMAQDMAKTMEKHVPEAEKTPN